MVRYICRECAIKLGADIPKNLITTMHEAKCDECGETKTVCSVIKWGVK